LENHSGGMLGYFCFEICMKEVGIVRETAALEAAFPTALRILALCLLYGRGSSGRAAGCIGAAYISGAFG